MANTSAPFGFRHITGGGGASPTFQLSTKRIATTNATAIGHGDPVMPVISTANGYITRLVPGTTRLAGIFWGCTYLSTSQGRIVWNNQWPGSDANALLDVTAYVIDDPNARFYAQAGATGFTVSGSSAVWGSSVVGQLAQVTMGTISNLGYSTAFLSSVGTTNTFPFIVTGLLTDPPGVNGTDPTTGFNFVEVGFNNEWLRTNSAVTGIA